MVRFLSTVIKVLIASLITGVVLTRLDISAEQILREIGVTPENVIKMVQDGLIWAAPNIVLGSMVIVPVWLVVYLFRPPRG